MRSLINIKKQQTSHKILSQIIYIMDFSIVVYIIIVIIVLYYFISWWSSDSTQMVIIHSTTSTMAIDEKKGAKDSDVNCAYSIWINVTDTNGSNLPDGRIIFTRDDIKMSLDATNNLNLKVNFDATDAGTAVLNNIINTADDISLPMQKWVNIIISFESNYLTVYIDGKMVASKIITSWGAISSETTIGGDSTFSGEIANFKFFNDYLTVQDAWEIYKQGYGSGFFSGLINKYKLKVAFLKDNSEVTSFQF